MKTLLLFIPFLLLASCTFSQNSIRWDLDSLDKVGGNGTTVYGSPQLVSTSSGKATEFDGVDDGLFVSSNPMVGFTEFTIEAIFKPYSGGNFEQRWIHFQQNDDNRILVELRYANNSWYLDTFIKSGASSRTLIDATKIHDMDKWYHISLVYKNGVMTHYVNGIEEATGAVTYAPVTSGQTSLGVRQTMVNYFKGAIKTVKVTGSALAPSEFMSNEAIELNGGITSFTPEVSLSSSFGLPFPNPAKESAKVMVRSCAGKRIKAVLLNSWGVAALSSVEIDVPSNPYEIKIARDNLSPGIYYLLLQEGNNQLVRALVFE